MLSKRFVGVITIKDGWAVQSFGYQRYLPLGRPEVIAENLDRWKVDEIVLMCIDRSSKNAGPDLETIEKIGKSGIGTPVVYAGGIRNVDDASEVIKLGADRIAVDTILHETPSMVQELSNHIGAQAVIAALPVSAKSGQLSWLNHKSGEERLLSEDVISMLKQKIVSEALLIDWKGEGHNHGFNFDLISAFDISEVPLIAFGGFNDEQMLRRAFELPQVCAVGVGNFLNYKEHAVYHLKSKMMDLPLRPIFPESAE